MKEVLANKTDLCNAMENDILHLLMMVSLEGTDLLCYDFSDTLSKIFQSKKF